MSAGMPELAAGRLRTERLSPEADEDLPAFVAVMGVLSTECLSPEADADLPAGLFVTARICLGMAPTHFSYSSKPI